MLGPGHVKTTHFVGVSSPNPGNCDADGIPRIHCLCYLAFEERGSASVGFPLTLRSNPGMLFDLASEAECLSELVAIYTKCDDDLAARTFLSSVAGVCASTRSP